MAIIKTTIRREFFIENARVGPQQRNQKEAAQLYRMLRYAGSSVTSKFRNSPYSIEIGTPSYNYRRILLLNRHRDSQSISLPQEPELQVRRLYHQKCLFSRVRRPSSLGKDKDQAILKSTYQLLMAIQGTLPGILPIYTFFIPVERQSSLTYRQAGNIM